MRLLPVPPGRGHHHRHVLLLTILPQPNTPHHFHQCFLQPVRFHSDYGVGRRSDKGDPFGPVPVPGLLFADVRIGALILALIDYEFMIPRHADYSSKY